MAYVPGYKHDLFLSYARAESTWVEAFRAALTQAVHEKLGIAPGLWQDVRSIRFGQDWTDEIGNAIRAAAAFLAICSPSYFDARAEWCAREYGEFAPNGSLDGLSVGSFYRLLKVIKTPDAEEVYKDFYPKLQAIEFFNKSKEEYLPGSNEFAFIVRIAASAIADLLRTMRNSKQALYVGTPASDMQDEWTQFRTQLLDYGYDVRPRVRLTPALAARIERELERSLLAIFLLGGVEDAFVDRQIQAAKDAGRRLIVWINPRKGKARQSELESRLLDKAPSESQVMGQTSIRDFIKDLVELLAPRPHEAQVRSENTQDSVYLMHDANQPLDVERADRLRTLIRNQHMIVLQTPGGALTPDMHDRFMRECDGLLLYRGTVSGPDKWLFQNVSQVQFAEKMYELHKRLKAKTFLLANPGQVAGVPDLDVLPYSEPLTAALLQPFFDKMRQGGPVHAGN